MPHEALKIGEKITVLPVIHGSGDFALEVRRVMLEHSFDCVAVPLPPSFQLTVEAAIPLLPIPTMVLQNEPQQWNTDWTPESDHEEDDEEDEFGDELVASYVPIDPCQGVIMALRIALGERIPREFIDLETASFRPFSTVLPDPYALKHVQIDRFAAAMLPSLPRLPEGQARDRVVYMANRLRELENRHDSILFVCSVLDWPWIREAYLEQKEVTAENDHVEEPESYSIDPQTLLFFFGELPFITGLYERARAELEDDENLSIDGVKELLVTARDSYLEEYKGRARKITPHLLAQCLKYIRNLSLLERRLTPDLYTIVIAAKQTIGDGFAMHVAEASREYPVVPDVPFPMIRLGIEQGRLPDEEYVQLVSRLPGSPLQWRSCELKPRPLKGDVDRWKMGWDPFSQCSWPPEDDSIENFRAHVFDRAKAIMGADLVRTEKFTTSIKDGIDIRDTLRNWHTGDIYVKNLPPARGNLDAGVMLFDSPADPRDYTWRTTWFAEHENESTLAFYATDFSQEIIGPGIALANYGGAMFLFPPRSIPDIWSDPRLDFTETMEERLLAAACIHSNSGHIVLMSPLPPGAGWRRLAKRFQKKWVHVPLSQFSDSTVQQLRMVHVLNGREVRSFASHFIRKA